MKFVRSLLKHLNNKELTDMPFYLWRLAQWYNVFVAGTLLNKQKLFFFFFYLMRKFKRG